MDSETLQYLTMEQAAADVVNFARTIVFPFDLNQSSVATKAVSFRVSCCSCSCPEAVIPLLHRGDKAKENNKH